MEYFKKSLAFAQKNYLLFFPLFVAVAIPQLITIATVGDVQGKFMEILQSVIADPQAILAEPEIILATLSKLGTGSSLPSLLSIILAAIAYPAVYGLIKTGLKTGRVGLDQFKDALKDNFMRYLMYIVGTVILGIAVGLSVVIVFLILGFIVSFLGSFGIFLLVLAGLAAIGFGVYFGIRISLWVCAMIIDELGIIEGLKKSFAVTRGVVGPLLGIPLLVYLVSGLLSLLLGFMNRIPYLGPLVLSIISPAATFIIINFYMLMYYERVNAGADAEVDITDDVTDDITESRE